MTTATAPRSLLDIGRSALSALIDIVPRALWQGVKGAFSGSFLMGMLGLALGAIAAAGNAMGVVSLPRWLVITNVVWVPFVFAVGGGYTGAIHGFLSCLSEEVEKRGLAARLYAVIKPVSLSVARRARGGQGTNLGADLKSAMEQGLSQDVPARPPTLGERAEVFLASQSRRILVMSVLRILVTSPDRETAIADLETFGVRQLTQMLGDTLEDLFSMQVSIAAVVALVLAAAPALIYAFLH